MWKSELANELANYGDAIRWIRSGASEAYAAEMLELHTGLLELEERGGASSRDGKVQHLGEGVFVQWNQHGIDSESRAQPATITRREQRHMARLAIEAVSNLMESKHKVIVTGQPGCGKTRGGLAYTLQELLSQRQAVMRVGHKSNEAFLFLPAADGSYTVWEGAAENWRSSLLVREDELFVLMDPPESGDYADGAKCRVIKYASNNQKHFHNIHKDGVLLVTATPELNELLAMVPVLWNDMRTPFRSQQLSTLEEKEQEVRDRAQLVGCIPRFVFDATLFVEELKRMEAQARALGQKYVGRPEVLLSYQLGETTGAEGHECAVSGRIFSVEPQNKGLVTDWRQRRSASVALKDLSTLFLKQEMEVAVRALDGADADLFERFVGDVVKRGTGHAPTSRILTGLPRPVSWDQTYRCIQAKRYNSYFRCAPNFPMVDYVAMRGGPFLELWNAKVGKTKPEVSSTAFVKFMKGLGLLEEANRNLDHGGVLSSSVQGTTESNTIFKLFFIGNGEYKGKDWAFKNTHTSTKDPVQPDYDSAKDLFDLLVEVFVEDASVWLEGRNSELKSLDELFKKFEQFSAF